MRAWLSRVFTKILSKRALWLSLAITCLGMLIFVGVFPAHYEENDDITMSQIAYGAYSLDGSYSSYLVFINLLLGRFLKLLLTLWPGTPWYTILQVVLVGFSFWMLTWQILRKFGLVRGLLPTAVLWTFWGYQFLTCLQFSKTAGIAVLAGLLLLFIGITETHQWPYYVTGGLLVIAGSLYRFLVFEMLLIGWAGVGVVFLIRYLRQKNWRSVVRLGGIFAAVFAICFLCRFVNNYIYSSSPAWNEYLQYNALRGELTDYGFPNYEANRALYESLGISENDLSMYTQWEFGDPDWFTIETMAQLAAAKTPPTVNGAYLLHFAWEITKGLTNYTYAPGVLIAALFCLLSYRRTDHERYILFLYQCIAFFSIQFYLFYQGRSLINRIDVSLFLSTFLLFLFYCRGSRAQMAGQCRVSLGLAGAILLTAVPVYSSDYQTTRAAEQAAADTHIAELIAEDPQHLYLTSLTGEGIPWNFYDIWTVPTPGEYTNRYPLGGWRTHSPIVDTIGNQYGVYNPFSDCIDNPDVYMISQSQWSMDCRIAYIREHYNQNASAVCVKIVENCYSIYRIITSAPSASVVENATDASCSMDCTVYGYSEEGELFLSGSLSWTDSVSFSDNIYIGLVDSSGQEYLYYVTQTDINGDFSAFSMSCIPSGNVASVNLYLETADTAYALYDIDISAP